MGLVLFHVSKQTGLRTSSFIHFKVTRCFQLMVPYCNTVVENYYVFKPESQSRYHMQRQHEVTLPALEINRSWQRIRVIKHSFQNNFHVRLHSTSNMSSNLTECACAFAQGPRNKRYCPHPQIQPLSVSRNQ